MFNNPLGLRVRDKAINLALLSAHSRASHFFRQACVFYRSISISRDTEWHFLNFKKARLESASGSIGNHVVAFVNSCGPAKPVGMRVRMLFT